MPKVIREEKIRVIEGAVAQVRRGDAFCYRINYKN